jgi:hypothetical protein
VIDDIGNHKKELRIIVMKIDFEKINIEYNNKYFNNKSTIEIEYVTNCENNEELEMLKNYYEDLKSKIDCPKFNLKDIVVVKKISEWTSFKMIDFLIFTSDILSIENPEENLLSVTRAMGLVSGEILIIVKGNRDLCNIWRHISKKQQKCQFVEWDENFEFVEKIIKWIATGDTLWLKS